MGEEEKCGLASLNLPKEKENEIFARCFNMVDYLSERAADILLDFLQNTTCPTAKQLLRNAPEVIAVKAFEKAIHDLNEMFRRPDVPMN